MASTSIAKKRGRRRVETIEVAELMELILQRRKEKLSFPEIAKELGYTQGYIYKVYKRAIGMVVEEPAREVVKMESMKLDALENELGRLMQMRHPVVSAGVVVMVPLYDESGRVMVDAQGEVIKAPLEDIGPKIQIINATIRIQERRAKLHGLDKPTKIAATNPLGTAEASFSPQFYLPRNGRDIDVTPTTEENQDETS